MSNFGGRRAPNVSQYLANLNTIPSQQDATAQNDFELNDEGLDFLTNAEFFDFDATTFSAGAPGLDFTQPQQPQQPQGKQNGMALSGPGYQFSEFQTYPQTLVDSSPNALPPTPSNGLQGMYPPQQQQQFPAPATGDKRKSSAANLQPIADLEEQSRVAAEEDKRRRNTAASARFRVKKKQREQALEKQAKEMSDKVSALEGKVQQLEMENKWLKGLITEKSDGKGMEEQFKKFAAERKAEVERSPETRTDGVGTEAFEQEDIAA